MKFHVILSRPFDLEAFASDAAADRCPRHAMDLLARQLEADVHQPTGDSITLGDRMRSKICGNAPEHWALARRLSSRLGKDDTVFTIGEDTGYPIAALCGGRADGPKVAVFVHNADHPRGRLALRRYQIRDRVDLFLTNTAVKADFLRDHLGLPVERVFLVTEQTDTSFFTPGEPTPGNGRPIIGSGGLEQRDYRTLAAAAADMDVDIRVCAVSPNAKKMADTFPDPMPANMETKHYDWPDLRQLYRDSDIVVISLKQHNFQAGLTTMFESLACRRPVVMTATAGLVRELADLGAIQGVEPGDPDDMRRAIRELLDDPAAAAAQAARGYELVRQRFTLEQFVDSIADQVRRMADCEQAQAAVS